MMVILYQCDILDFKIDTLFKTNDYFKIMNLQNKVVGISSDRSSVKNVKLNQ